MQGFHAVPVHLPDVRLTYFGGSRPAPFQGHTLGCPLCPQVYVMVVVDIPPFVDTAERTVKVGNAALGFQMQPHRALAAFEGGFRGIGLAVLVKQFDVVELIREVVPQPLPVVDGKVFGVFRRRADLDADDGIFDPFGLLQRQPHRIPYTRGIQTGRQQIVPTWKMRSGCFLFLDSPVMYLMSFIPWEMDFAFPIMARPPCLHRSLSRRAGGWKPYLVEHVRDTLGQPAEFLEHSSMKG